MKSIFITLHHNPVHKPPNPPHIPHPPFLLYKFYSSVYTHTRMRPSHDEAISTFPHSMAFVKPVCVHMCHGEAISTFLDAWTS